MTPIATAEDALSTGARRRRNGKARVYERCTSARAHDYARAMRRIGVLARCRLAGTP